MKETTKKQKKLYLALLLGTIAIVIVAVTLSLVFGLNGASDNIPTGDNPGITQPGGPETPDPETPGGPETPDPETPDPGEPTITDPEYAYELPVANYTPGMAFEIEQLVWSSTLKWFQTHNGTDFLAASGTTVVSAADGVVKTVGYTTLDGYYIIIEQNDGIIATYKSLTADIAVEEGNTVKAGSAIGKLGTSMASEQNEGAHLHLEMTKNGKLIDPMSILDPEDK